MQIIAQNGNIYNMKRFSGIYQVKESMDKYDIIACESALIHDETMPNNYVLLGSYPTKEMMKNVMDGITTAMELESILFRMPAKDHTWISTAITKVLTISNSHMREGTNTWLEEQDLISAYPKMDAALESYYGWYIPIGTGFQEYIDRIPEDLLRCIKFAFEHGCALLELDNDADEIPDLPIYKWEN